MKQIIIKITQWLTLLLSWLTISPLFVYLAKKMEVDRQESKNTAIAYLSFDADWLLYPFLVGFTSI